MKTMIRIDESFNNKGSIQINASLISASNLYRYLITVVLANNSLRCLIIRENSNSKFSMSWTCGSTHNRKSAAVKYEILAPLSGKP